MAGRTSRRKSSSPSIDAAAVKSYVLEDQVGFILRRAHQYATDVFNEVMAGFDVTPMQFAALAKLHDLGPTSQNQLGRLIAMDPATIFGVAGRLVRRGLVRQSIEPNDARLVMLALTPDGHALVEAMKARGVEVSRRTLDRMSREEAEILCRLLGKLV
jgi:DNA-binding MarR family transcriptional regulator